jgi:Fe-S cluster assembly iron-binding protein IscA
MIRLTASANEKLAAFFTNRKSGSIRIFYNTGG